MKNDTLSKALLLALNNAPLILFALVLVTFGALSSTFLEAQNLLNILIQSSSTIIVATGMTFVLLTAGVDLSVGAIMFVCAAVAGKMALSGQPLALTLVAMIAVGLIFGAINAVFITWLRVIPFIVTVATLFIGRGFALWLTETRAMNLPDEFLQLGTATPIPGIPLPVLLAAGVVICAHVALTKLPYGRQLYALGAHAEAARKAGVPVRSILTSVYMISALCAAIAAIISLSRLGAVSPGFGKDYEFNAIAAAVLGGTSLFGGRGKVFPGTVLGAVLILSVENGLVNINADPYLKPIVTSAVIFTAVLIDSARNHLLENMSRRKIRSEAT